MEENVKKRERENVKKRERENVSFVRGGRRVLALCF